MRKMVGDKSETATGVSLRRAFYDMPQSLHFYLVGEFCKRGILPHLWWQCAGWERRVNIREKRVFLLYLEDIREEWIVHRQLREGLGKTIEK